MLPIAIKSVMKRSLLLLFVFVSFVSIAQERQFWNEIRGFKKEDSIRFPAKKAILFVGSSSFRMWKTLAQDFPDHKVINRGFGGSGLPNVIEYVNDIIFPYKPKQVIVYCGENDFFREQNITPEIVAARFEQLFKMIRTKMPRVHIAFVAIKPSPRRQAIMPQMVQTNTLVKNFLEKQKRAAFINIYDEMLDAQGNPRKELFTEDDLHMNASGYAIWKRIVLPYLKKTKK